VGDPPILLGGPISRSGDLSHNKTICSCLIYEAFLLHGISKFPLTLYPLPEGRGRGEGANLYYPILSEIMSIDREEILGYYI